MKRIVAWGVAAALLAQGALGGAQQAASISARDKSSGAQAHPQLLAEFGGLYEAPQAAYVTGVGRRVAVQSGLANSEREFTISLLNSPVNNAFAIPGGYVYVTRQLMGLMNDEAELASVLGHEVGHVAARHSQKRQSAAQRNAILGALGQLLIGAVAGDSALGGLLQRGTGQAAQLLTLRYSRTQEYEADDLGIRYLVGAGYDPNAASTMLASLASQTALDARAAGRSANALPEWASTHPDPAGRVTRARSRAQATGRAGTGQRNREAFLRALNGTLYGDDPREGVVEGNRFVHPVLQLAFTVPQGFAIANGPQAVSISGSGGQAQFAGGALNGSLNAYITQRFQQLAGNSRIDLGEIRATRINGMDAAYATARAASGQTQVDVTIIAYRFAPDRAYHFVLIAPAGRGAGLFQGMVQSFDRITPQQAAAVRARRIAVVTVQRGDTVATLAARMAYADFKLERFLTINALPANAQLRPGQQVKIVVYG